MSAPHGTAARTTRDLFLRATRRAMTSKRAARATAQEDPSWLATAEP
jgi:hypothetical protein